MNGTSLIYTTTIIIMVCILDGNSGIDAHAYSEIGASMVDFLKTVVQWVELPSDISTVIIIHNTFTALKWLYTIKIELNNIYIQLIEHTFLLFSQKIFFGCGILYYYFTIIINNSYHILWLLSKAGCLGWIRIRFLKWGRVRIRFYDMGGLGSVFFSKGESGSG